MINCLGSPNWINYGCNRSLNQLPIMQINNLFAQEKNIKNLARFALNSDLCIACTRRNA